MSGVALWCPLSAAVLPLRGRGRGAVSQPAVLVLVVLVVRRRRRRQHRQVDGLAAGGGQQCGQGNERVRMTPAWKIRDQIAVHLGFYAVLFIQYVLYSFMYICSSSVDSQRILTNLQYIGTYLCCYNHSKEIKCLLFLFVEALIRA